ncbi:MAG: GTPase Era [Fimbriimonadaceae bacterium]
MKAGLVAVVGKPNVGKSTLINAIVGHKVSIVSDKVQTTRKRVLGIATTDEYQIVFVDTPGIHKPKHKLGAALNETAKQSIYDIDLVLVMTDCSRMPSPEDKHVSLMLKEAGIFDKPKKLILGLNKMDKLKAEDVERNFEAYKDLFPTENVVMTSLIKEQNLDILQGLIVDLLPENPTFYPEDMYTDQPMAFLAAEAVREKALHLTREEIPHSIATYCETWERGEEDNRLLIRVVILTERDGQKAIILGNKGSMIKEIGIQARKDIEEFVGEQIFLELFVKVRADWRQSPRWLKELDYI